MTPAELEFLRVAWPLGMLKGSSFIKRGHMKIARDEHEITSCVPAGFLPHVLSQLEDH